MIFDGRPIDEIKDEEFDALIQEGTFERQHLEFKETYDIKDPRDKLEVLRDIASLANGGGGYLILGMQDDGTGIPVGYRPQSRNDLDKMKKSIQQLCLDHIAERIPRLQFRIREPNNKPILVIHIPDSIQAPHMVKFNRRTDFYTRYDNGKREMSISEIRAPVMDIANKLGKTCSALRQRASAKGWNRPTIMDKPALLDEKDTNQNPEVSKRITSGIVLGGQVEIPPI